MGGHSTGYCATISQDGQSSKAKKIKKKKKKSDQRELN